MVKHLSNLNPLVSGQLKIPGFSEYLHPLSDSLLLGLGQETTTTVDERVIQLGVKLSLFDVAVPESPKELDVVVVGARGSFSVPLACLSAAMPPYHVCSQLSLSLFRAPDDCYKQLTQALAHQIAATEHKAFLYHTPSGLLAVPMHVRQLSASQQASLPASSSLSAYGHEVAFDGAYVYYVRDKRIKFHTRVTHSQANKRTRSYGYNEPRQIYRSACTSTCFSTSVAVALCNIPALSKHMYAHKQ